MPGKGRRSSECPSWGDGCWPGGSNSSQYHAFWFTFPSCVLNMPAFTGFQSVHLLYLYTLVSVYRVCKVSSSMTLSLVHLQKPHFQIMSHSEVPDMNFGGTPFSPLQVVFIKKLNMCQALCHVLGIC